MTEQVPLDGRRERIRAQRRGDVLRAAAAGPGVPAKTRARLLEGLHDLEPREYDGSSSSGYLSDTERLHLWGLRSALAGAGVGVGNAIPGAHSELVLSYWHWLLAVSESGVDLEQAVPGDLVDRYLADPEGARLVAEVWQLQATMVGRSAARTNTDELSALLEAGVRDGNRFLAQTHRVALLLADLSGMPEELVTLHRDEVRAARQQARGAVHARQRADLEGAGTGWSGSPVLGTDATGNPELRMGDPELDQLRGRLTARALRESVVGLRAGAAPTGNLLFQAVLRAWRERLVAPRPDSGAAVVSTRTDLERAKSDVLGVLESDYRGILFDLAVGSALDLFPEEIYGPRLASNFSADHVTAAYNYLRELVGAATVAADGTPVTDPSYPGIRGLTAHMARSAPRRWGGTPELRQARRTEAAAVAIVAQDALDRCLISTATSPWLAEHLVREARRHLDLAVADALASFVGRQRLTSKTRNAAAPQTPRWHREMRACVARIAAAVEGYARATAGPGAYPDLHAQLREMASGLRQMVDQQGHGDLPRLSEELERAAAVIAEVGS